MIWFSMQRSSCKNSDIYPEMLFGEEGGSDIHTLFPRNKWGCELLCESPEKKECEEKLITNHLM